MSDRVEFARPSYRPEQRSGGLDPDMRRMAVIAAGFGGVLALVIGGLSLSRHAGHTIPVIAAPAGPVRIKPVNPGGMQVEGADAAVAPGEEKLSPPEEQPELSALHARLRAARQAARAQAKAEAAKADAAKLASAKAENTHAQVAEVHSQLGAAAVGVAQPIIAPPAPVQHASATRLASLATLAPNLPLAQPPVVSTSPAQPVKSTAVQAGTTVQLAALESQASAEQAWGRFSEKMPELFKPHRPEVVRADVAGRTVWRLRTGGFPTLASAVEFCTQVRAKGSDCSIAAF